jgi:hypothetical protein
MGTLGEGTSQWMLLAGIALLTVLVLHRTFRRYAPRRSSGASSSLGARREQGPGPIRRSTGPPPAEVAQWQVEMYELARELKGELDTKMRLLQLLIDQARCEAQRLQTLLAQVESRRPPNDRGEASHQG